MKYNISDLMDQAVPMAVELEEQPVCLDNIKDRAQRKIYWAGKPKKQQPKWLRLALVAACVTLLMAVTVGGSYLVRSRFTPLDDRRIVMETKTPVVAPSGPASSVLSVPSKQADFSKVYLPTQFPGEAELVRTYRFVTQEVEQFYRWEWDIDGKNQLIFDQRRIPDELEYTFTANVAGITREEGEVQLAGYTATYMTSRLNGRINSHFLIWDDGEYLYELKYSGSQPLEELEQVIASLEPVDKAEYLALLEQYLSPTEDMTRQRLEQVLLPGQVPEELIFGGQLEPDSCRWYLQTPDKYQVVFYQEDLDCLVWENSTGSAQRRWRMQDNPYLVPVELAGRTVQLLGGDADEYVWEYFWEQDGNWCMLRIDVAVADLLGMEIQELAERIVENLTLTDYTDAEARFE